MRIQVEVKLDHLQRLVARRGAVSALAEIIWNSLDGDAKRLDVELVRDDLTAIQQIKVKDDGIGIDHEKALSAFQSLGDSWKKRSGRSAGGRQFHGRAGEGRFAAFALGESVTWRTRWRDAGRIWEFTIHGQLSDLGVFEVSDPVEVSSGELTGTEVTISRIDKPLPALFDASARDRLLQILAPYLRSYPDISITFDGFVLDPMSVEKSSSTYPIDVPSVENDSSEAFSLTIVEWHREVERSLHFCDQNGISRFSMPPGVVAPGFNFTAYIKGAKVAAWDESGVLPFPELYPETKSIIDSARRRLRQHFRERSAEYAKRTVAQWKEQRLYPYVGPPRNEVESVEREVFDVLALNLNDVFSDFADAQPQYKRFSMRMLRAAIESGPREVHRIIQEVLDLPKEKREELAQLLDRTSLSAIINAAKIVGDRLDFITGLESILFDSASKARLKERQQLHRIVAENTWIFGEEYNLSVDDESLNQVLAKHLHILGQERVNSDDVTTLDGGTGIVDLMLSRRIPVPSPIELEHLVIELKRPSRKVDGEALGQLEKYAFAVAADERFRDVHVKWTFWVISNDLDAHVRMKVSNQSDRPDGLANRIDNPRLTTWVKTWGQVIQDSRARLRFFEERLQYRATQETGRAYLRRAHLKYLPQEIAISSENDILPDGNGEGAANPASHATRGNALDVRKEKP